MESFYGGRQGASIVIKARFKYVTDQTENGNYKIWVKEFLCSKKCLICLKYQIIPN